jgi:hypothetical protein
MAKVTIADEVAILRFFECGPLDKAETLFTIVADKMRERLRDRGGAGEAASGSAPKRRVRGNREEPGAVVGPAASSV